jgi:hypothetical protein
MPKKANKKPVNNPSSQWFVANVLCFLSGLHSCYMCKDFLHQINGKGKQRKFCNKYGQPINRVRDSCIDRFAGFNSLEINKLEWQWASEEAKLIKGVVA